MNDVTKAPPAARQVPRRRLMPVEFGLPVEAADDLPDAHLARATAPRVSTGASISLRTDAAALEAALPPGKGLRLRGDPVLTLSFSWDAGDLRIWGGRSYHIVSASIPVTFKGREGERHGDFRPIIFENLADPIIAGRESLGWSKVYAEIESPRVVGDAVHSRVGWCGFQFLDIRIDGLRKLEGADLQARQRAAAANPSEGSIHWKYIPRTGTTDQADADYLTMSTRQGAPSVQMVHFGVWTGTGTVAFRKGGWRDLPSTFRGVVDWLADLPVHEVTDAAFTRTEAVSSGAMGRTIILE